MAAPVSKIRAKKARTREKAGKKPAEKRPLRCSPYVGGLIALALWAVTLLLVNPGLLLAPWNDPAALLPAAGDGALLLVCLFALGVLIEIVRPQLLQRNSTVCLLALICLLSVVLSRLLLDLLGKTWILDPEHAAWVLPFALPYALAPLLGAILVDAAVGVSVGAWTSIALAMLAQQSPHDQHILSFPLFITGIVAAMAASRLAEHVRSRAKVFRIGIIAGLAQLTCVFAVASVHWEYASVPLVVRQASACLLGGLFSAMIVLLILPLFESVFHITTDITLLELSDLGHPLLQRLAIEAPGTYHHSLVVANLAQAAAQEIGANALLVRICAYFHDIGKLTKPDFFSENIQLRRNPHDDLPPSMSTLIITAHVKEGETLARLHKLPQPVRDVIREHHGTSLLSVFHYKAKNQGGGSSDAEANQTNGSSRVSENDFRYSGPRPSSRESAIISLADPVEAASRCMEKTTPSHTEGLVEEIINRRIQDGQLDECQLTLAELTKVKRSFVFTLTNMLHGRVPYPKNEDRNKQSAKTGAGERQTNPQADRVHDGAQRQPAP